MTVVIVTMIPSPYQVELFDALARVAPFDVQVIYRLHRDAGRSWQAPELNHTAVYIDDGPKAAQQAQNALQQADLAVIGDYHHQLFRRIMQYRQQSGRRWCFWGERPGFRVKGWVGRWYRRLRLWPLYRSTAPIWGIGQWAIEGYRKEFGSERPYHNVPYFSNLERFAAVDVDERQGRPLRVLYSGSFTQRKGVDLLAQAFIQLSERHPHAAELHLLGDGPLRATLQEMLSPVRSHVIFHGFQPWEALPSFYAAADVLCAPSRYDGWGLIVPEGLAAGLPVVATDKMGAAHDLLNHRVNGLVVPAGNATALSAALRELLTEGAVRRMSTAARQTGATHQLADGVRRFERAVEATIAHDGPTG